MDSSHATDNTSKELQPSSSPNKSTSEDSVQRENDQKETEVTGEYGKQ